MDSSALYAVLDRADARHVRAAEFAARAVQDSAQQLVTHSYVIVEAAALIARRLGSGAVRDLFDLWCPRMSITFVDEELHERAVAAYTAGIARRRSFVDRVSFEWMKDQGIRRAFAFDVDFANEGFEVVP